MQSDLSKELFAVLFAAGEPVELARLCTACGTDPNTLTEALTSIDNFLKEHSLPLNLLRLEDRYQLVTQQQYNAVIKSVLEVKRNTPLSQAAMEVLAIIAYNQPATKSFVEQIRGVDSSGVVNSLVEKGLIEEAGRLELPGRPIAYGTSSVFLRSFGISSLEQLPTVEVTEEELDEEQREVLEGQLGFSDVN